MKQYWLVRINNFDSFMNYMGSKYNFGNDIAPFKDYYYGEDYLYLFIRRHQYGEFSWLSYCKYDEFDGDDGFEYMGEYHGRKEKLERLKIISKL